jgi:hypothetical protein
MSFKEQLLIENYCASFNAADSVRRPDCKHASVRKIGHELLIKTYNKSRVHEISKDELELLFDLVSEL